MGWDLSRGHLSSRCLCMQSVSGAIAGKLATSRIDADFIAIVLKIRPKKKAVYNRLSLWDKISY
jgi:hypothetical protein